MKYCLILNNENYYYPSALEKFLLNTKFSESLFSVCVFTDNSKFKNKIIYNFKSVLIMGFVFLIKYVFNIRSIKKTCLKYKIPVVYFKSVNGNDFLKYLSENNIEIGINLCSQIYKISTLRSSKVRFFNVHPSLLPANKGRFPIFWALLNNDRFQGVSCHEIIKEIDAGKILWQQYLNSSNSDGVLELVEKYSENAHLYIEKTLEILKSSKDINNIVPNVLGDFKDTYGPEPTFKNILEYKLMMFKRSMNSS